MLYGSLAIISITLIIDFIEDYNYKNNLKINNNYNLIIILFLLFTYKFSFLIFLLPIIIFIKIKETNIISSYNYSYLTRRITSFSLDSLFNFSLYNSNIKGLNLFISIDNFLLETANHINLYKKISFYLQKYTFNKFLLQINLNLILSLIFIIIILLLI